jgi:hypothetical protein
MIALGSTASVLSGENMPQDRNYDRRVGYRLCARTALHGVAAASLGLALGFNVTVASAQTAGSDSDGVWNRMMRSVGLKSAPDPNAEINYTERPPLVVPPSRNLPAPADQTAPAASWPQSNAKSVKHARAKDQVVPSTAVQTPNPPFQKKPWYNPAGWFSKEEYASFNGEPVRQDLTEPPAGYRVPSASQPYGLGPDKKGAKPTASDMMMTPVTGQSPGH